MRLGRRLRILLLRGRRALVIGLALVSYLTAIFGLPVPRSAGRDGGSAFLCQHRACGCSAADRCLERCCCFPRNESPLPTTTAFSNPPPPATTTSSREPCCVDEVARCPECHNEPPPAHVPCCVSPSPQGKVQPPDSTKPAPFTWVLGFQARECQGQANLWLSLSAGVVLSPLFTWVQEWQVVEWLRPTTFRFQSLTFPPSTPPPRS